MRFTSTTVARTARLVAGLSVAGVTVGLLPTTAHAATEMTALETLNVRSAPSTSGEVVGGLYRGQTVTAVSTADGWTTIRFEGRTAYVSSVYLAEGDELPNASAVDSGTIKRTTTSVNLRKGPGLSYAVIKVLSEGTQVTLTGKTATGFSEVVNGKSTGWVSTQYLAAAKGLPAVVGTRVATAALDIRTTSGTDAKTVTEVKKGTVLSVTGATANGRAQIVYQGAVRWVTAKYLANPTRNQPVAPKLPKITGIRYATAVLNIRSNNTDNYTLIAEVPKGTALSITGVVKNGRMRIVYNGAVRWVTAKYLSTKKPAAAATGTTAAEKGLKPNAIKTRRAVLAKWPQITTIYGVRADPIPDHPSGRAIDIMIPNYKSATGKALGKEISRWAQANAKDLGVQYVIWDQRIWNIQRDAEGWRFMADRGGDSANHKNHVHITVYA